MNFRACDADAVERRSALIETMPIDEAGKARLRSLHHVTARPEHCPRPEAG